MDNQVINKLAESICSGINSNVKSTVGTVKCDKSYRCSILGINKYFADSVDENTVKNIISTYNIPDYLDVNYYTVNINGKYYCIKSNGNFNLYEVVGVRIPNGDWDRVFIEESSGYNSIINAYELKDISPVYKRKLQHSYSTSEYISDINNYTYNVGGIEDFPKILTIDNAIMYENSYIDFKPDQYEYDKAFPGIPPTYQESGSFSYYFHPIGEPTRYELDTVEWKCVYPSSVIPSIKAIEVSTSYNNKTDRLYINERSKGVYCSFSYDYKSDNLTFPNGYISVGLVYVCTNSQGEWTEERIVSGYIPYDIIKGVTQTPIKLTEVNETIVDITEGSE